jgi:hypothetical protein
MSSLGFQDFEFLFIIGDHMMISFSLGRSRLSILTKGVDVCQDFFYVFTIGRLEKELGKSVIRNPKTEEEK